MANTIKHKRGSGSNPSASDLEVGELAIRTDTGVVFTKKDDNSVAEVAGGLTNNSDQTGSLGVGTNALNSETSGTLNTAFGEDALDDTTTGNKNVSVGYQAGNANTTGFENSILGYGSLKSNTTGYRNVAIGANTLEDNTTATNNTGVGYDSLKNCTGSENTAIGSEAGDALTSGSNNIIIGNGADASSQTVSNELTIGNSSINSLRIPGLQNNASDGQVLTFNSSNGNITLADASSGAVDKISEGNTEAEVVDTGSDGHFKVTTEGTERLRIDSSGRVGIGASNNSSYDSAAQNLLLADESGNSGITIRSGGSTPFGAIHFADGTSSNAEKRAGRIMYGHDGDFMLFSTANSEAMRIDSSGNVGIGTTSPSSWDDECKNLVVASSSHTGITIAATGSNQRSNLYFSDGTSGSEKYIGGLTYDHADDSLLVRTAATERMRIDSSGNVGIGTSSPKALSNYTVLTLNNATQGGVIEFQNDGTSYARFQQTTSALILNTKQDIPIVFGTGTSSTERLRISSSGNVGIGTSSPSQLLDINGNCTISSLGDISGRTFTSSDQVISNRSGTSNCFVVQSGGSNTAVIKANGDVETDGSITAERIRLTGAIYENDQNISANYSITSGSNAMSAGPITIDSGVTVTVTSGCTWTVV